jgi:hypothetical protein
MPAFRARHIVRVVDDAKRHELLLLYIEDLSTMGVTASDLVGEGYTDEHLRHIQQQVRERARASFIMSGA